MYDWKRYKIGLSLSVVATLLAIVVSYLIFVRNDSIGSRQRPTISPSVPPRLNSESQPTYTGKTKSAEPGKDTGMDIDEEIQKHVDEDIQKHIDEEIQKHALVTVGSHIEKAKLIRHPKNVHSIGDAAYSPDGTQIALLCENPGTIWLLDVKTNELRELARDEPDVGYHEIKWAPDGKQLAVYARKDSLEVYVRIWDTRTGATRTIEHIASGAFAWADNEALWFVNAGNALHKLQRYDLQTGRSSVVYEDTEGTLIAYLRRVGDGLVSYTRVPRDRTTDGGFWNNEEATLRLLNLNHTPPVSEVIVKNVVYGPYCAWSSDGRYVAYLQLGKSIGFHILDTTSNKTHWVKSEDILPKSWSPNGDMLLGVIQPPETLEELTTLAPGKGRQIVALSVARFIDRKVE